VHKKVRTKQIPREAESDETPLLCAATAKPRSNNGSKPLDAQARREVNATVSRMLAPREVYPPWRDVVIADIAATEENIVRTRQQLADLQAKLARQHAEFYRQTLRASAQD
jgi:hypothetical protein